MNHDSLLATYSLLTYIRESSKEEEDKSILRVFLPILKETLNHMLRKVGTVLQGRDYTELMAMVEQEFGLKIPIPVIDSLMHEIYRTSDGGFILNNDHSFIIRTEINTDIASNYKTQKRRIQQLKRNFALFCESLGVEANFNDLVTFIQDQKIESLNNSLHLYILKAFIFLSMFIQKLRNVMLTMILFVTFI